MKPGERLLICGASARAAAMSARGAGLPTFAIDLFNDLDLRDICPSLRIGAADYADRFADVALEHAPPGPWMYTGALENYPAFIDTLAYERPLWGSGENAVTLVRDPCQLATLVELAGMPAPETRPFFFDAPADGRWLAKPVASAGGSGIHVWRGQALPVRADRGAYFQRIVPGPPYAAVFFADGQTALLIGVTRQLIGEPWLHARPFAYCGSLGPLDLGSRIEAMLIHLGRMLSEAAGLRGLFGIDFILHEGQPWTVEVNPRYTASVEVIEMGLGLRVMTLAQAHFEEGCSCAQLAQALGPLHGEDAVPTYRRFVAKGILFAPRDSVFLPQTIESERLGFEEVKNLLPEHDVQDVSQPGTTIRRGQPVLTVFARGGTAEDALGLLQQRAARLDRWLFPK